MHITYMRYAGYAFQKQFLFFTPSTVRGRERYTHRLHLRMARPLLRNSVLTATLRGIRERMNLR